MSPTTQPPLRPRDVFARFQQEMLRNFPDPDLYAEDVVVETPFAPPGRPRRIEGREEFLDFARAGRAAMQVRPEEMRNLVVHDTADPEVIVVEYELAATMIDSGESMSAPFIAVLRVRDGKVALWREYQNVLAMAEATGQLPALLASLGGSQPGAADPIDQPSS